MKRIMTVTLVLFVLGALTTSNMLGQSASAEKKNNKIFIHDGIVMSSPVTLYLIWYGNWGTDTAKTILPDFVQRLGGSPYHLINTSYYSASGRPVSGSLTHARDVEDSYSRGVNLTEMDVQMVVLNSIINLGLPADFNGLYLVLGSADINVEGVCTERCEFHDFIPFPNQVGSEIKYAYVGDASRCPNQCMPLINREISPNGNSAADATASWITHVISGMLTNPTGNGWFDRKGRENSDKCEFRFGDTYLTANGAVANVKLGARDFLIQQNWVNAGGGYCALSYPSP